jgi:hypothetical protein
MAVPARPLAIALLHLPEGTAAPAGRTQARVALALRANDAGYALVETFEFGAGGLRDDLQFQAVEELAAQLDVQALIVAGAVDPDRVEKVAARWRLVVHAAPATTDGATDSPLARPERRDPTTATHPAVVRRQTPDDDAATG